MSDFSDWYEKGWTVERATESKSNGTWGKTWATNLSNLDALFYQATARERQDFLKSEIDIIGFVELDATDVSGNVLDINEKDRFKSPRGEYFSIETKENPHNLNEFLKFGVSRTDVERQDE